MHSTVKTLKNLFFYRTLHLLISKAKEFQVGSKLNVVEFDTGVNPRLHNLVATQEEVLQSEDKGKCDKKSCKTKGIIILFFRWEIFNF